MANSNITIPGFTGDMLADYVTHEAYCAELGIDPDGSDDTVFGTSHVYCSSHRRGHTTGWCTVRNVNKVPLNAPTDALAVTECRALGYSLYEDDKR